MTYLISVVLILFSALFSGLTLGLMALDVHELKRKKKLGNIHAKKVYRVRKRGNLLLTTLLFGNVGVNAILSIFLGSIASGVVASIIAISLIFIFGEILPQAIISRHALIFGARTAWFVQILLVVFYPVCGPIAWVLDKMLGHEIPTIYSRNELMSIIEEHEDSKISNIDQDEERIVKGALTFSEKKVEDVMTPKTVSVMININEELSPKILKRLSATGHSRIPVYAEDKDDIVGVLYLKDLVGIDKTKKTVADVYRNTFYHVQMKAPLDDVLNRFLNTKHHLFIVVNDFDEVEGVISVEDIIEEIVGKEIIDESDQHADMRQFARQKVKKRRMNKALKNKPRS